MKRQKTPATLVRLDAVLEFPTKQKALAYYKAMEKNGNKSGLWRLFIGKSVSL